MSIFKNNLFYILSIIFVLFGVFFNYLFLYFILGLIFFLIFKIKSKYLFFLFSVIFFSFFLIELIFKDKIVQTDYFTKNNISYEINNNYGYHPKKNEIFTEEIFYKNELLKKNFYTINKYGHRDFANKIKLDRCIIFHGGSLTFGQSLSDNETLPYMLGNIYAKEYNIFNFAFNGYGPHQFLAKLKSTNSDEIEHCNDIVIIYQFINDHIARTAGKRSWGDKSPRFIFKNERLIQKGFFSDYPFKFIMKLRKNFRHSKVSNIFFNLEKINQKDKEILLQVLKNIEILAKNNFNNTEFIYLIWNNSLNQNKKINYFFSNKKTIFVNDLGLENNILYNNIPGDNHPTKEFNLVMANEIKKILK